MFEKDKEIQSILEKSYNYILALDYSWERYFYNFLKDKTKGTPTAYSKGALSCCYTGDCCCKKIPCEFMIKGNKFDATLTGVFDNVDFIKVRSDFSSTKMSLLE